ncbi:MAG: DUF2179 domain-containing protein [Deltaproteobacteria bacterium]|nr:DUF2179 domain-containing protein [Deltaproteobacteria bacterium]
MFAWLSAHPQWLAPAIFLLRIGDVSLGTVRTISIFRGHRVLAAVIGFFEVLIWLTAVGQVLGHLDRWYLVFAYAAGFAAGNIVGIAVEAALAMGDAVVRVISPNREVHLAQVLRAGDYFVTALEGHAEKAMPVEVLFVVTKRRSLKKLLALIEKADPLAFCTVEDVRRVREVSVGSASGMDMYQTWIRRSRRK